MQGARVERLQGGGEGILRREIDHHFHVERVGLSFARDSGLFLKGFGIGRQHGAGRDVERDLFVLGGQGGVAVPIEGADPFAAVAHQPIDVVFSFTDIEGAGEDGIAAGIGIDHGDVPALREVDRVVGLLIGRHAEDHGEHVVAAGEVLERDADIVAGVEFEVEAENGFDGRDRAGNVFANLPGFEDCRVGSEEPHRAAGSGGRHEHLGGKTTACHHARTSEELRFPHPSVTRDSGYHHHFRAAPSLPMFQ